MATLRRKYMSGRNISVEEYQSIFADKSVHTEIYRYDISAEKIVGMEYHINEGKTDKRVFISIKDNAYRIEPKLTYQRLEMSVGPLHFVSMEDSNKTELTIEDIKTVFYTHETQETAKQEYYSVIYGSYKEENEIDYLNRYVLKPLKLLKEKENEYNPVIRLDSVFSLKT